MTLVVNSINYILIFVQCDPPRALWDHRVTGKCWDPRIQEDFALFVAGIELVSWNPSPLADAFLSRKYSSRCRARLAPCDNLLKPQYGAQEESESMCSARSRTVVRFQYSEAFDRLLSGCSAAITGIIKTSYPHELTARSDLTCRSKKLTYEKMLTLSQGKPTILWCGLEPKPSLSLSMEVYHLWSHFGNITSWIGIL